MDHSYEEIRNVVIDIVAGREKVAYDPSQYEHLLLGAAEVLQRREGSTSPPSMCHQGPRLSDSDRELFREIFGDLFRQGVITLGLNDSNLRAATDVRAILQKGLPVDELPAVRR